MRRHPLLRCRRSIGGARGLRELVEAARTKASGLLEFAVGFRVCLHDSVQFCKCEASAIISATRRVSLRQREDVHFFVIHLDHVFT